MNKAMQRQKHAIGSSITTFCFHFSDFKGFSERVRMLWMTGRTSGRKHYSLNRENRQQFLTLINTPNGLTR